MKENGTINTFEGGRLFAYNEKVNMMESLEIGLRKKKIREEELKEMELERIKKRVDEDITEMNNILSPNCTYTKGMVEMHDKACGALIIYRELISGIRGIMNNDAPFRTRRIIECIEELEDKYYPQPKTTKEKITNILNEYFDTTRIQDLNSARMALIKLRDEIED